MHYSSIRSHLRPYLIVARRKTTINHAFAAAIAPSDEYSDARVRGALQVLGQDPDKALVCVYCEKPAETWDHVFATVKDSAFSGHGHRLGNLLPCCKACNSSKGNKDWRKYLRSLARPNGGVQEACIERFLLTYAVLDKIPEQSPEYVRLLELKAQVLVLMAEADQLAKVIRTAQLVELTTSQAPQPAVPVSDKAAM
jgi:hypothetical protein